MNCQNSASVVMAISVSGSASALRYNHIMPGSRSAFETSADLKILGAAERQIRPCCRIYAIQMKLELN